MFQELIKTVKVNISTVRSIIQTNDRLRKIAFGEGALTKQKLEEDREFVITTLIQDIPKAGEWRVYDHCAVITRLYAIYERFVEELVTDWIRLMPEMFPLYSELEDRVRDTHQMGVGQLLLNLKKSRFQHLSIEGVVRGLFRGVTDEDKYELVPDAFLLHEQNLRKNVLENLFADVGISNAWNWVEKHRAVKYFVKEIRASENTAEGELNELISYRNDAAHGAPIDNVLGSSALLELCDFVEALCQALAEVVIYRIISRKTSIGQAREIGLITEWFKQPKAAVAKVKETTLAVGGSLFLVSEARSYCHLVTIENIKIQEGGNDVEKEQVKITSESEVGLKFNAEARKELRLYIVD